ncbi:type II toxin-antitoxin system RelE/ParE family toxin [Thiorhodococcus mannitoliphagus]|uniref:Type II toxin-antitoxin system RelE/ParE family toxin n=1 Tax=Thiorhodococcus mannitoliphagus TaxID=329406 RepID=A0A6P1DT40_9GAMM|nr:type II toxin-antitoxin system RelE/ParE family toxin [Thiorhodococcus mannitoliphagus]NEX21477.1 type II toxin-antitoxin system RelE/ParE family toxin [Thiorhodococcus mannitoliphagus]
MAGELIWSRTAVDDIDAIATWIARDSAMHARLLVERVMAQGESLLDEPGRPRLLVELDEIRVFDLPAAGFRVLYERHGDDLHLLAVIHNERTNDAD